MAAASRLSENQTKGRNSPTQQQGWQDDAWDAYDQVGEQRFLVNTLANRLSQADLYVGKMLGDGTDVPEAVSDKRFVDLLEFLQGSTAGKRQMLKRMAENLSVAGDVWLVGIPRHLMPEHLLSIDKPVRSLNGELPYPPGTPVEDIPLEGLEWRALSVSEVSSTRAGEVVLQLDQAAKVTASPSELWTIRVWDPHPRKAWEANSSARSSLPVLREIIALTQMISAQVDSRLAGAGVLVMSQSISRALKIAQGLPEDEADEHDNPLMEALIEYMSAPIKDRSSAAALVPLILEIPDDVDIPTHLTFGTPLDEKALDLREEAIRRLALSQDAPPELLLGTAGVNHWGAWLVREDVVSSHLEPPLALICDALTQQYLWPVLVGQGMSEAEARQYVIWYDVSHLITSPNKGRDARELHATGVISDEALREANGFDDGDIPEQRSAEEIALQLAMKEPRLIESLGMAGLVESVRYALGEATGAPGPVALPGEPSPSRDREPSEGSLPDTDGDSAPEIEGD